MSGKTNFYHIGLFSVLGIALFIVLLMAMGGSSWFSKPVYIETYFNESVQGLEIGSAVKYRGVLIGRVANIDFVNDVYGSRKSKTGKQYFHHYVYVLMAINLNAFNKENQERIQQIFTQAVRDGMRVHLSPEGLTGSSYLELDFFNPKANPPLKIDWIPQHPYIPSKLSTFSQITTHLNKFIEGLSDANIPHIMTNIDHMTGQTNLAVSKINNILSDQQQNIEVSLANMRVITNNLRTLTDNAKNYPSSLILGSEPPKLEIHHEKHQN